MFVNRLPGARHQQTGVALVLVLTLTALLTIMAGSYTLSMRRELDLVRNGRDHAQAMALAESGLHYAQLMLQINDQLKRWRTDGTEYKRQFGNGQFIVKIIEETGKINVNKADVPLLTGLFESSGIEDEEEVGKLVDAIIDWRDNDEFSRVNGAEKSDYDSEGLSYHPRNDLFQTIEELQLVMGITPEVFEKIEKNITIYTENEGIDPTKASRDVLMAIPGVDPEIVDTYLADRDKAAQDNLPSPAFPVVSDIPFEQQSDNVYSIESTGLLSNGTTATLFTTLQNPKAKSRGPYAMLSWKKVYGKSKKNQSQGSQQQGATS